jgi:SAM-dependent methyltransferase
MKEFHTRDPTRPEFWDERFEAGVTPWDAGGPPAAFMRFVASGRVQPGAAVLVPGCGRAWEVDVLDRAGWRVLAIDFSPAALERARSLLGARAGRLLRQCDFFGFESPPFDWIYERTFVPALVPALWPAWAGRVAALTQPGSLLAGFFFIDPAASGADRRGPPFATRRDELDALLGASFECLQQEVIPASESIPVLAGREWWLTWRRRA